MEDQHMDAPSSPTHISHSTCLVNLLLLLGEDHEMDRLADLLHYTAIAERQYATLCKLRNR